MINSIMILDFWFKECTPKMWFKKDKEFDNLIKNRFQKILEFCLENKINNDHFTKEDYLSWIIVLDQFSRNIYRNQIKSFAGDEKALKLSKIAIKKSFLIPNEDNYNSFFGETKAVDEFCKKNSIKIMLSSLMSLYGQLVLVKPVKQVMLIIYVH